MAPPHPPHPRTLFDKVWKSHVVEPEAPDRPALIHVDLHLVHEVTSPQAFSELNARGLEVRRPDLTIATIDHSTPTLAAGPDGRRPYVTARAEAQVAALRGNCARHGIELFDWESPNRGVVHVIGPEQGLTWPGMVVVCGDSHTSTHGAFGALAFGIGTSEVGHVLATQCLFQRRPRTLRLRIDGRLPPGVGAKDLALAVVSTLGFSGGTGHVIEYAGEAVRGLGMEGRMTLCNMSIEAGARAGMVAPDETAVDYLRGRPRAPVGDAFDRAAERWLALAGDDGAAFDGEISLDASALVPMATWGSSPDQASAVDAAIPTPGTATARRALDYMRLEPGKPLIGTPVDVVFVGSCTNGRISDLRAAAAILRDRRIDPRVRMLVAPGSEAVRREAEAEGLHEIFLAAGAEWRLPGCSMCIAMNGDQVRPGKLAVSTSNRNFEGRQGPGARTILASPATAAASAVAGAVADPRTYAVASHAG
ncbi:MAG: 3-isopropylmalate dehydratase large subunit [Caulobacteraceae bacterium]|nr:3-isopropylmalate dehydratase large subunit [Caulobacteraceae bacterium]